MTTMTEPTTATLDVPGATLTYDIRRADTTTEPPLFLIGSPMAASGFGTLASSFPERTVITYDPRGAERSVKTDGSTNSRPAGAVNALALVAAHAEDVRTLVAHEPPLASQVADREAALAAVGAVGETYQQRGSGAGMAHFIAVVGHKGEFAPEFAAQPGPDPAMFGMPAEDDGKRDDVLLGQNLISCTAYQPDYDALRAASTRVVIGVGAESEGELARRGGEAAAAKLGLTPVVFPSGHGGFLGDEYGQRGEPEAFAATLREALTA